MRWILLVTLWGCTGGLDADGPLGGARSADAGEVAPGAGSDAGTAASTDGGLPAALTACSTGKPDAGIVDSPGPVPAVDPPAANWAATGAEGCNDFVPRAVSRRRSWSAPERYCFEGDPRVDGSGNLVFAYATHGLANYNLSFFPADGGTGRTVTSTPRPGAGGIFQLIAPRPSGFYATARSFLPGVGTAAWIHATAEDGSDEGVRGCEEDYVPALWPDPRGGYAQSRVRVDPTATGVTWNLEVRWVHPDLSARTQWWPITSWNYDYNVDPEVHVDVNGNALVLLYFDPPMSMPCNGDMTRAAWVSEEGTVTLFTPVTPSSPNTCGGRNFATFGEPVALADGGLAFYVAPRADVAPSGWYAYTPGSGKAVPAPEWLQRRGPVQRLASGAYLGIRRDAATCARTADIFGRDGQLCASVSLAGSEGCDEQDLLSTDGTLALHQWGSCSVRWWPLLGRAR